MQFILGILQRILSNPKTLGYIIIFGSTIISKKYNFMDSENTKHNAEPLFLPRGSVRALITLILTVVVLTSYIFKEKIQLPEEILMMWFGAVGYYIGFRTDNSKSKEIKV